MNWIKKEEYVTESQLAACLRTQDKRIEKLELKTDGISESEIRLIRGRMETQSERINTLFKMLEIYKHVLDTSGIISRCEADRTEFQWDEARTDYLGRNFHFKVNKVQLETNGNEA